MPTCVPTAKPNTYTVKVGCWVIGQLNRTTDGFTFSEARSMDVFDTKVYATAIEIRNAITVWYAGQEPLACN